MRAGPISLLLIAVLLFSGCGSDAASGPAETVDVPDMEESVAPPWARLLDGTIMVEPEFRAWTEWPFGELEGRPAEQLAAWGFQADQRLMFLNVTFCMPEDDITMAYGWGLADEDGTLLNDGYTTISLDWLEPQYQQPETYYCGEGWIGVVVEFDDNPTSAVWFDAGTGRQLSWPLGSPIDPIDIKPVADNLTIVDFGEEAEASNGSYWTALDLVSISAAASATAPPAGKSWWVVEARYCAPLGDTQIWDGLQLAVDGWYVFDPEGRDIALDPAHPEQDPIPAGDCGLIWETFAIPNGLQPSTVRLQTDDATTIWQRRD